MRLYLTAETSIPDLYIDYIEVLLKSGEEVSLNWDYSDIERTPSGFSARYKGVYFDEDYANGRIEELRDMKITDIGVYYESKCEQDIKITIMEFVDDYDHLTFSPPELIREGCVTVPVFSLQNLHICSNLIFNPEYFAVLQKFSIIRF